jgi:hypothetical protein
MAFRYRTLALTEVSGSSLGFARKGAEPDIVATELSTYEKFGTRPRVGLSERLTPPAPGVEFGPAGRRW